MRDITMVQRRLAITATRDREGHEHVPRDLEHTRGDTQRNRKDRLGNDPRPSMPPPDSNTISAISSSRRTSRKYVNVHAMGSRKQVAS